MEIKSAEFITSARNFADVKKNTQNLPQIAFVGRSNVGKSSLINMLCNRKLAITSSTPGRTRLINFFLCHSQNNAKNEIFPFERRRGGRGEDADGVVEFYMVDLPGYGFASAAKSAKDGWNDEIGGYLTKANIKLALVVLDLRIKPTDNDIMALNFLQSNGIPFAILGSKADKVSKGQNFARTLGFDIILTSAKDKTGREAVLNLIHNRLAF